MTNGGHSGEAEVAVFIGLGSNVGDREANLREALLALVQNTYMNWLLDGKQRALEFDFLSTLVTHIPVRRIIPHSDPARIVELCELIVTDAKDHEHSRQSFQAVN